MQGVSVWIDGKLVKERPWVIMKNNFEALRVDADFEVPEAYSHCRNSVTIKFAQILEYKFDGV